MAYEQGGSNPPPNVKKQPPNVKLGSLVRWTLLPISFFFFFYFLLFLHCRLIKLVFLENWSLAKTDLRFPGN